MGFPPFSSPSPATSSPVAGGPPRSGGGRPPRGESGPIGREGRLPTAVASGIRRRPGLVWAGVTALVVSSVGFTALLAQIGQKSAVLEMARRVPAGAVVTARDLRVVRLGIGDSGARVMPAARSSEVVGKVAVVPLAAGELLAPDTVGRRAVFPPAGKALLPFEVDQGGLPAGLAPGERVAVVPGPVPGGAGAQPGDAAAGGTADPVVGMVTDVAPTGGDGATGAVVTLLTDAAAAGRAAQIDKPRLVVLNPTGQQVP